MKLLGSQLLAVVLIATPGLAQEYVAKWSRITDEHGSSVEIPASMLRSVPDATEKVFLGSNNAVRVSFSTVTESRLGFPGNDPEGDMNFRRSDCDNWPPSYHVLKERLAAYSCVRGEKIVYYVAHYSPFGSVSLHVEYPEAEKPFWNKAVARMSASMRQVRRKEVQ